MGSDPPDFIQLLILLILLALRAVGVPINEAASRAKAIAIDNMGRAPNERELMEILDYLRTTVAAMQLESDA